MLTIRPNDRIRCRGCGQLLTFGPDCLVPGEQLAACRSMCDWVREEAVSSAAVHSIPPNDPAWQLPDGAGPRFAVLADIVRSRRTAMRMDVTRDVPAALLAQLCELATWAPNHKRLEPWRFAVLTGVARATLGELTADEMAGQGDTDPDRLAKSRGKYLRAPAVVVIGSAANDDPVLHAENRDAVAAATQNFLLAATAAGLQTYWGTGMTTRVAQVKQLVGLAPADQVVAIVYVGWPAGSVDVPPRAAPRITWLD